MASALGDTKFSNGPPFEFRRLINAPSVKLNIAQMYSRALMDVLTAACPAYITTAQPKHHHDAWYIFALALAQLKLSASLPHAGTEDTR
jgi:hypothetical protein